MSSAAPSYVVVERDQLDRDDNSATFLGGDYGQDVSFILVDMRPGDRVRLHRHAYAEIFIVLEGRATYTIGAERVEARAGQTVIVSPGVAHGFANTGSTQLRQVDIHLSGRTVTEWLE